MGTGCAGVLLRDLRAAGVVVRRAAAQWTAEAVLARPDAEFRTYNALDCERTWEAVQHLVHDMHLLETRPTHDLMLALARPAYRMQEHGVLVDPDIRARLHAQVGTLLSTREHVALGLFNVQAGGAFAAAAEIGGFLRTMPPWGKRRHWRVKGTEFNVRSRAHLVILFEAMGMHWDARTPTRGDLQVDLDVIGKLRRKYPAHEVFLSALWEYKKLEKLRGDWLEDGTGQSLVCRDGRLRASFRVCGATSGRGSEAAREWCACCQEWNHGRNRQNLPKTGDPFTKQYAPIRTMVVPGPGRAFVEADFIGVEAWIGALLSGDTEFIRRLRAGDVHSENARDLFALPAGLSTAEIKAQYPSERRMAKIFLYGGVLYLGGAETIQASFEREGLFVALADIKTYLARWKMRHQRFVTWQHESVLQACRTRPYCARTALGRHRLFFGKPREWERAYLAHRISGPAADYKNHAFVDLDAALPDLPGSPWIVLDIHDSLVTEVDIAHVAPTAQCMYDVFTRPRCAEIGRLDVDVSWSATSLGDLKPWEGLHR